MNKKKLLGIITISMFSVFIVTAALVSYLSNTVTGDVDVKSPISIEVINVSDGTYDDKTYTSSIYGGGVLSVDTTTTIHVAGVTGHIAENKIVGFDGTGITVEYTDGNWAGVFELPVCISGSDAYFYIGDPTETLNQGFFDSTTTFTADLALDPDTNLEVETKVILASAAACDPIPTPIYTP